MSGGALRIKLLDTGEEYEMPENEAFPAMLELERSGMKFDATEAPTRALVGGSVPGFEPDPSLQGKYPGDPLEEARAYDLMVNDGVSPTERMSEATVGVFAPGARAGLGFGANVARNALSGGAQAGLQTLRDTGNWYDALESTGRGALMSGMLTQAGPMVSRAGGAIRGVADDVAGWFGRSADENRILATGKPAPEVEAMGAPARAEYAQQIEDADLNGGMWPFKGPKSYARSGTELAQQGEQTMRTAEDRIAGMQEPPQVDVGDIVTRNREEAQRVSGLAHPANENVGGFRNELIDRLEADTVRPGSGPVAVMEPSGWNGHEFMQPGTTVDLPSQELPWPRALEQRRNLDQNANWQQAGNNEPWNNATTKEVANDLRGAIDTSLDNPDVPIDVANNWRTGRDQTALGLGVRDDALAALGQKPAVGVPTSARGAVGTAANLAVRMGGHNALAAGGRAADAATRFGGAVTGGPLQLAGGAATNLGAPLGAAAAQPDSSVQQWLAEKGVRLDNVSQQTRGNRSTDAAMQLFEQDPQVFGAWQPDFADAMQRGPRAVRQLINRLEQDPAFRMGPYRQIQQMTAAGGSYAQ